MSFSFLHPSPSCTLDLFCPTFGVLLPCFVEGSNHLCCSLLYWSDLPRRFQLQFVLSFHGTNLCPAGHLVPVVKHQCCSHRPSVWNSSHNSGVEHHVRCLPQFLLYLQPVPVFRLPPRFNGPRLGNELVSCPGVPHCCGKEKRESWPLLSELDAPGARCTPKPEN